MTVRLDTRNLDQLIKAFKGTPKARVGVLGDKNRRKEGDSNAEIGAKHEFGEEGLPKRSWLRQPLIEQMNNFLERTEGFDKEKLKEVVRSGKLVPWVKKIGIVAEDVVAEGFRTGGFGKWKPSNMKMKKNHQTLVETQQLRNSVTSEVKEK